MSLVTLSNLGKYGLIQDKKPYTLPIEAWSGAQGIRFQNDGVSRALGYNQVFNTPTIDPYWAMSWADVAALYYFYANGTNIYRTDGATDLNVTRAVGGNYSAGSYPLWNGGVLNGVPVMNSQALADYPQSWNSGSAKFEDMPGWPANWYAKVLRPFGHFLIAMDITKSSVRYPTLIAWSNQAASGTIPSTWTPAATNDAGEYPLSDTTSWVVDCLPMGDVNIVYKEDSVYAMRYIGGENIFDIPKLFSEFGLLSSRAVKSFFRKHFVVTQGDIILHDSVQADSIVNKRMRNTIFNSIDSAYYDHVFVADNPADYEMWVCVPETGSGGFPTKAHTWNWKENTWGTRDLPSVPHILTGILSTAGNTTFDGQPAGVVFDDDTGVFNERAYNPSEKKLLYCIPGSGKMFAEGDTTFQENGSDFTSYVERTGLPLAGTDFRGNLVVNAQAIKFIDELFPHMDYTPGTLVDVYVADQMRHDDPITWHGPYSFDPSVDTKINCAVSSRYLGYKFQASSGWFRLTDLSMNIQVTSMY